MLQIRQAQREDAPFLQELYLYHLSAHPREEMEPLAEWEERIDRFSQDENYHLLVGTVEGQLVSSVTLIVIPNLTHGCRPYALIENVVTHTACRGRGYAGALLEHACRLAKQAGCYKVMLLTGSKRPETLRFYERCGFNRQEKTGFYRAL